MPIKGKPVKEIQFKPLTHWNGPRTLDRTDAPFRVPASDTVQLLRAELGFIKAENVVISLCCRPDQIRDDGYPRAGAVVDAPQVSVSFTKDNKPLQFSCDKFTKWHHNLRGIALTLERLRLAELYGCTQRGEQYAGFAQLPGPEAGTKVDAFACVGDAIEFMKNQHTELYGSAPDFPIHWTPLSVVVAAKEIYRKCAAKLHPDNVVHGNADKFRLIKQAWELIEKAGG